MKMDIFFSWNPKHDSILKFLENSLNHSFFSYLLFPLTFFIYLFFHFSHCVWHTLCATRDEINTHKPTKILTKMMVVQQFICYYLRRQIFCLFVGNLITVFYHFYKQSRWYVCLFVRLFVWLSTLTFENLLYPKKKREIRRPRVYNRTLRPKWTAGELIKLAFNIWSEVKHSVAYFIRDDKY